MAKIIDIDGYVHDLRVKAQRRARTVRLMQEIAFWAMFFAAGYLGWLMAWD